MGRLGAMVAGAAVLAFAGPGVAQTANEVEIITQDLGSGLYALYGRGGTIGVSVGEDGVFVIDDQIADLSDDILGAIAALSEEPVRYVLNTHWHGDHVGGNEAFREAGAVLVAHENVRARMASGIDESVLGQPVPPANEAALQSITISENATFYMNGQTARVIHVPRAHTDGDTIVVFEEANVIHMGDIFWNGFYPLIDVVSGGSLDGMIAGLAFGLSLADDETQIIAGHGPMGDKAAMQAAHDVLVDVCARIEPLVAQGLSQDEAVAADALADLNGEWGDWFIDGEMMTRLAYRSISARPE